MISDPGDTRTAAIKALTARRRLVTNVVVYVIINAALLAAWFINGRGYFWPGWILSLWGCSLLLQAWDAYWRRPITEQDIRWEMDRLSGRHPQPH